MNLYQLAMFCLECTVIVSVGACVIIGAVVIFTVLYDVVVEYKDDNLQVRK